jgi:uncharacterized protein DUF5678
MTTLAQAPLSEEALEKYSDRWVAVRGAEVVAAAATFEELTADEHVRETDAVYHVPSATSLFY